MNAKLIVEGKEFDIEIYDLELQKLIAPPKKHTGYERVNKSEQYWNDLDGRVECSIESNYKEDKDCYEVANYYSDKTVAENNVRADKLMRQLRKFAVEHREKELDWSDDNQPKYYISVISDNKTLDIEYVYIRRNFAAIYFDSKATTQLAIDTFHDELVWYFTEYKDSL